MANRLDSEVLRGFLEEARGYIPGMEENLALLKNNREDREALAELHRLAHNVRGASNVIGLGMVAQMAEGLEALLDQVSEGGIEFDEETAELVGQGLAQMSGGLAEGDSPAPAPGIPRSGMEEAASELIDGFLAEAEEHLQIIGSRLASLEEDPSRKPVLQEVRRSVHTIKGAGAMVGVRELSSIAHRMEDLLDRLYEDARPFDSDVLQLLFATYDLMSDLVNARGRAEGYGTRIEAIFQAYAGILGQENEPRAASQTPQPPGESESEPAAESGPEASKHVRVPLERLDLLVRQVGEVFVQRSAFEQQLTHYVHEIEELKLSLQRLKRIASQLESDHATFTPGAGRSGGFRSLAAGGSRQAEFDALEFDRYTQLHLLSRDLNEAVSDVAAAGAELRSLARGFDTYVNRQGRLTSEIQDKLMRLRMVPLSTLANRLNRTVRVTANQLGKLVDLTIEGAETELDKTVLEQLAGPLEHLLRNAVDHGIEWSSERAGTGKHERGAIRLKASQEGTEVLLRLSDDGRGLDHEKLRAAAVREGFSTEQEARALGVEQLEDLIFLPGMSTADEITDISGRGVGLDVVKASVEALAGTLQLRSKPGQGAEFTIRLPMTLAITKVLMVEANQEKFALPLASVTKAARVEPLKIQKIGRKEAILIGEQILPVVRLADSLRLRGVPPPQGKTLPLVAVRVGEQEFALVVDNMQQAREVVVKPLTGLVRKVPGVAAATILGDGSVVLILNPAQLLTPPAARGSAARQTVGVERRVAVAASRKAFDILIVDDSLSVRRVIANLMRNTGWNPVQAKDGVEALEVLDKLDRKPDAILMDIEMPQMDGFELASRLRSRADYKYTPILMLTSRAGDKHRNKALGLGVTDYLVKPYQDEFLLGAIRKAVGNARRTMQVA
jgi:chemosensory pili system protein ChpA (sensor histidine kinase/response regulator)